MGLLLLVLINLIFAATPTFMKVAAADVDAICLVWLRHTCALLAIVPIAWRVRWQPLRAGDCARIALAALLAFSVASLLQVTAVQRASASAGALMIALEPVAMIILAVCCLHERLQRRQMIALLVALSGFFLLTTGGDRGQLIGNLLYVLAVFCEAAFPILLRPLLASHPPAQILCCTLACASLFLAPFQWSHWPLVREHLATQWLAIGYLGIGCSALASYLWLLVLRRMPVSTVAVTWFLQPVCGSLMAVLFLHEQMTLTMGLGGALIVSAVALLGERKDLQLRRGIWYGRQRAMLHLLHAAGSGVPLSDINAICRATPEPTWQSSLRSSYRCHSISPAPPHRTAKFASNAANARRSHW